MIHQFESSSRVKGVRVYLLSCYIKDKICAFFWIDTYLKGIHSMTQDDQKLGTRDGVKIRPKSIREREESL